MKKLLSVVIIMLIASSIIVFSAENDESSYFKINMMLNNSKKLTDVQFDLIHSLSSDLTSMQRTILFETNKQSATLPFVVNFIVGFGIGSYIQGDSYGGSVALAGDLVSLSFFVVGYSQALNAAYSYSYTGTEGAEMILVGTIGMIASRIFQLVRPFTFTSDYNKKLSNSLMNLSMLPVVDFKNENDTGIRLAANISF